MQPDFWNDKRPAGVPLDIDQGAYKSVIEVFERSCKKFADRPAFSNMGITLTYAELERYSAAFAGYLQAHTDLVPGDRIAVQMPNVLHYPILITACLRQTGVATAVFRHAVGQQDHRLERRGWQPLVDEEAAAVTRGQPESVVDHGDSFALAAWAWASLHCIAHPSPAV